MPTNYSSAERVKYAENIKILPSLSEKIIREIKIHSGKVPLILYFQASYVSKSSGEKISTGDGFVLQFVEENQLIEDISGESIYVKTFMKKGDMCILRIPRSMSNKILCLDLVSGIISSV